MENKEKTLEFLSSERNNLNEMREFITERWNTKRRLFKMIILCGLISLLHTSISYSMSGKLTPLGVISTSMLTSMIYCSIRDFVLDKAEYGSELKKIEIKLSVLDNLERELD
ncbi:MAG: hypothetical protein J6D47_21985 [Peptostreptococcaceae bacterium]|nr:hypothetical protein [Peptostreptococcaceae bacterium]